MLLVLAMAPSVAVGAHAETPIWTNEPVRIDRDTQELERIATQEEPEAAADDDSASGGTPVVVGPDLKVIDAANFETNGLTYRIVGITGLKRRQVCVDGNGHRWACGMRSRVTVNAMLRDATSTRCIASETEATPVLVNCTYEGKDLGEHLIALGVALPAPQ